MDTNNANRMRLQVFDAAWNQLNGSMPAWPVVSGVTPTLQILNIGNNLLTGAFSTGVWGWTTLQYLNLEGNSISGDLITDFYAFYASQSNLRTVLMAGNSISNSIPLPALGALLHHMHALRLHATMAGGLNV